MAVADMIPVLDDQELANLRANARRLEDSGNNNQKQQAAELMPLIEAEVARRLERNPPKPKRAPSKRKVAAAAKAAADAAADAAEA